MKQGGDMLGKRDQVLLSFEGVLLSRAYNCETRSSRTSEQPSADTPRLVNVIDVHGHGTIASRLWDVPFLFDMLVEASESRILSLRPANQNRV
jgi:hypothetical protein